MRPRRWHAIGSAGRHDGRAGTPATARWPVSVWLSATAVSRGIAIGRVHRMYDADPDVPEYVVDDHALDDEITRFRAALDEARGQLAYIHARIPAGARAQIGVSIETHLLMTRDSALSEGVAALIRRNHCNAEWVLKSHQELLTDIFEPMDDSHRHSRADAIAHVAARIQRVLLNRQRRIDAGSGRRPAPPVIVADGLTPADIILLHEQGAAALITQHGGPLSHNASLARSLRLPAVAVMRASQRMLLDNETIIVDGGAGHVLAAPEDSAVEFYRQRQKRDERYIEPARR